MSSPEYWINIHGKDGMRGDQRAQKYGRSGLIEEVGSAGLLIRGGADRIYKSYHTRSKNPGLCLARAPGLGW
jgi:hypothetical protein